MSRAQIPWTAIVGIAGISATVLIAHITNKAAEGRMRIEHEEASRTRFHNLRVELYGKLFDAITAFRMAVSEARPRVHELTESQVIEFIDSFNAKIRDVNSCAQLMALVAAEPTRQKAAPMIDAMMALAPYGLTGKADFEALYRELDKAEAAFMEAARAELLPRERSPRKPRFLPPHAARWLHWAALACEVGGTTFVYLEAQRTLAQLHAAGFVSYGGGPPPGYTSWIYESGRLGFLLLLAAIILTGVALTLGSGDQY